jgi:hypothetical protein
VTPAKATKPAAGSARELRGFAQASRLGRIEASNLQSKSQISAERLRCLAKRLHGFGEQPLYELLRELDSGAGLPECFQVYAKLDADVVKALGADELSSLRSVDWGWL